MFTPQQPPQQPLQQQPQQQQPPPLTGQNQTPFPPGTCAPQNYCANGNIYYRYSDCRDELRERCENGCTGVACNVSRSQTSDILSSALTTSTRATSTPSSRTPPPPPPSSSAIDRISDIANPSPAPSGEASSEPLVLTIGADEAVRIQDEHEETVEPSVDTAPMPPASQQTFISQDLSMSPSTYSTEQRTALQAVLAAARETLAYIIAYLRPFGRPYQAAVE